MTEPEIDLAALDQIQRRVLWLAVRMVDHANRERAARSAPGGRDAEFSVKVGGHMASSASMVSIMTALWFGHLGGADKVAVKPHASPVFHAIKYLQGELDRDDVFAQRIADAKPVLNRERCRQASKRTRQASSESALLETA